jgi:hypothetical protein
MMLVMTLLARDEADIIDAQIAFHLNAGVDFVIATDNGSEDGTTEILESYARAGYLHLIREESQGFDQSAWVTRMARLAATDFGAEWVINSDADEFWWPRREALKAILAQVPTRFATVRALLRNFVPRPNEDASFADRMTARLVYAEPATMGRFREQPFHPQDKVVHRAHSKVIVKHGNHDASWPGSRDLRGWWPIEVLHFPVRSLEQCARKARNWKRLRYPGYGVLRSYGPLVVDDAALVTGLGVGSLVIDTRLKDALQALQLWKPDRRARRSEFRIPLNEPAEFSGTTLEDDARFASDLAFALEQDSLVKVGRRIADVEQRIVSLERGL